MVIKPVAEQVPAADPQTDAAQKESKDEEAHAAPHGTRTLFNPSPENCVTDRGRNT